MPRGAAAAGGTPGLRLRPPPGARLMRRASASVGAREGRPVCGVWGGRRRGGAGQHAQVSPLPPSSAGRRASAPAGAGVFAAPPIPPPPTPTPTPPRLTSIPAPPHSAVVTWRWAPPLAAVSHWLTLAAKRREHSDSCGRGGKAGSFSGALRPVRCGGAAAEAPGGARWRQAGQAGAGLVCPIGRPRPRRRELPRKQAPPRPPPPHLHRLRLWVDVDKHERLAAAPQAGLQQVCELGVAVGYVGAAGGQRLEHVAQAGQALVDVARLLGALTLRMAARQPLAARKGAGAGGGGGGRGCERGARSAAAAGWWRGGRPAAHQPARCSAALPSQLPPRAPRPHTPAPPPAPPARQVHQVEAALQHRAAGLVPPRDVQHEDCGGRGWEDAGRGGVTTARGSTSASSSHPGRDAGRPGPVPAPAHSAGPGPHPSGCARRLRSWLWPPPPAPPPPCA